MPEVSKDGRADSRPGVLRSLASKYSIFTGALVFWAVATLLAYDLRKENFDLAKGLLLCLVLLLVSGAVAWFTIRLLARPLKLLQDGIASVRRGRLEPIQFSRTGDEIEFLGESFNSMIEALAASRKEIQRIQEQQAQTRHGAASRHTRSELTENVAWEVTAIMKDLIASLDSACQKQLSAELREQLLALKTRVAGLLGRVNDLQDLAKLDEGIGSTSGVTPTSTLGDAKKNAAARILVVEDNQVNQKVVVAALRKSGYVIELANDGREALNKLEAGDFDLVLMDVQMPVLDGLEATRQIRNDPRWKTLPIVAMTAHAMNGDKERCLDAGMNGYISKPVHPSHLLQTVESFLSSFVP